MLLDIRFHMYAMCAYRQALLVGRLLCNRVVGIVWYVMCSYSRVLYCYWLSASCVNVGMVIVDYRKSNGCSLFIWAWIFSGYIFYGYRW